MTLKKIRETVGFSIFFIGVLVNYVGLFVGFGYKTANEYLWGNSKFYSYKA